LYEFFNPSLTQKLEIVEKFKLASRLDLKTVTYLTALFNYNFDC
jgi:hypothetical protein